MLLLFLLLSSCKKELLVKGPDNLGTSLSIAEAKDYFEKNMQANVTPNKLMTVRSLGKTGLPTANELLFNKKPSWQNAYQKILGNEQVVKVPLDFGLSKTIVDTLSKSSVPTSSLNYLLFYKDEKGDTKGEWIKLVPDLDWLKGDRATYKGRILVLDWGGNVLKHYRLGQPIKPAKSAVAGGAKVSSQRNQNISASGGIVKEICGIVEVTETLRRSTGMCKQQYPCTKNWCDMCFRTCAIGLSITNSYEICVQEIPEDEKEPARGDDYENIGNDFRGGSPINPRYLDYCNPDPNYVDPIIEYPDGTSSVPACRDIPIPTADDEEELVGPLKLNYKNLGISNDTKSLAIRLDLSLEEAMFLEAHLPIRDEIIRYLAQHPNSVEANDFAKWTVGYWVEFPEADINTLIEVNNIPNSNINLPILDTSELGNYPAFKALVEDLPNFLNRYPKILQVLSITTGFTEKKILELMKPGKGPKVVVVKNLKNKDGIDILGNYEEATKTLQIDDGFVNGLDAVNSPARYQGIGLILVISTLHEFTHYGTHENILMPAIAKRLKNPKYESGWYFEDNIDYNALPRIQPDNVYEWMKYFKIKPKL